MLTHESEVDLYMPLSGVHVTRCTVPPSHSDCAAFTFVIARRGVRIDDDGVADGIDIVGHDMTLTNTAGHQSTAPSRSPRVGDEKGAKEELKK